MQRPVQQLSLGLPAVRDVPGDGGGTDGAALCVEDWRDTDGHVYARAVLAQARGLVVLDVLTAPQALEDAGQLFAVVRRDEQRDRLADRLLGRVSVEARRGRVPRRDHAVERLADDGIVGRFHHGLEVRHGRLGVLQLRDVPRDAAGVQELPTLQLRVRAEQDVADRPIAVTQPRRDVEDGLARAETPEDIVRDRRVDVELAHVPADILIACHAHEVQLGSVGAQNGAVPPQPRETDRRLLEEVLEIKPPRRPFGRRLRAIAPVHRYADRAHDGAHLVSQRLHVRIVAAVAEFYLV